MLSVSQLVSQSVSQSPSQSIGIHRYANCGVNLVPANMYFMTAMQIESSKGLEFVAQCFAGVCGAA